MRRDGSVRNRQLRRGIAALFAVAQLMAVGCTPGAVDDDERPVEAPGTNPWNDSTEIACTTNDECGSGEACEDGVCVMARCVESYESVAPLGKSTYFGTDAEVTVISDETWVDAFESTDGSYMNSWDLAGGGRVLDVTGGNMMGERPQTLAVATEFSEVVRLNGPAPAAEINVGLWPKVLASGDVDGDGLDELVAFADDGSIAICDIDEMTCSLAVLDGASGKDVAVGDIDGDGFAEPIFLYEAGEETMVVAWNTDAEITGQEEVLGWSLSFPARAFAAGDLDGDLTAEMVLLEDGGWWGWANDKVHVFSPAAESVVASASVDGHTLDVALGDRNSDEAAEIGILREGQKFELLTLDEEAQLQSLGEAPITVGQQATRISMVDWDGDSAFGRLVIGPELVSGETVPLAALYFPPYPEKVAVGALSAKIGVGETESTSESNSDTVSLGVGLGVSYGAEALGFKAKVSAKISASQSYSHKTASKITVGARYSLHANPDLYGSQYAGVITSCGCYHRYRYETDDPKSIVGGSGQTVDLFVPVGGQTMLWSSRRYNAVAEASGKFPVIPVPARVGDVTSYPTEQLSTEGEPIHPDDIVFPDVPSFQLSDVGYVSFRLSASESETNSTSTSTTIGTSASFGAFGAGIDVDAKVGVSQGYSVSVGTSNLFSGAIPPVPDDPSTPEDEFEVHRYSFKPVVYRHHYDAPQTGEAGAYYVLYYSTADYAPGQ